jgi:hypothetical protein
MRTEYYQSNQKGNNEGIESTTTGVLNKPGSMMQYYPGDSEKLRGIINKSTISNIGIGFGLMQQ